MAVKLENGYTRLANELLEAIYKYDYPSASPLKITLFVLRKTYGFQKKQDILSLTQIVKGVQLSRPTVVHWLEWLVKALLLVKGKQTTKGLIYGVNKDYEQWLVKPLKLVKARAFTSKTPLTETSKTPLTHKRNKEITKERAFSKPNLSQINQYILDKDYGVDGEAWLAFYESNGWMVGKNKMRSWKGALTTWEKRNNPTKKPTIKDKIDELYKQGKKKINGYSLTTIKIDLNDLEPADYSDETKKFLSDKELITKICAK